MINNIIVTKIGNPIMNDRKFASGYTNLILSINISPVSSSGQNNQVIRNNIIISNDNGIFFVSDLQKYLIQNAMIIAIINGTK